MTPQGVAQLVARLYTAAGRHYGKVEMEVYSDALYDILLKHDVPLCRYVKESFFFEQQAPDLAEYSGRFGLDPAIPFVEISPSYFGSLAAMENLRALFPEAFIVITLRHPADRLISAVKHVNAIGVRDSFEGIEQEDRFAKAKLASDYETHVTQWAERFPGRVLVLRQVAPGRYSEAGYAALRQVLEKDIPDAEFIGHRANQAAASRSRFLTAQMRRAVQVLRRAGAHRLVRALKVLRPLFFRRLGEAETGIDRAAVEQMLAREIAWFDAQPDCAFR